MRCFWGVFRCAARTKVQCVDSGSVVARACRFFKCKSSRESSVEMRSRKFCAKIARKICKISGNPARPAHKNCVHSASVRCAYFTTSLRVDRVSIAFRSEKESVQRRDHANFAPNSRERIAKFPRKIGAPRAQKLREVGQRCCAKRRTSLQLFSESVCILI